jgi:hypothetical protein
MVHAVDEESNGAAVRGAERQGLSFPPIRNGDEEGAAR